MTEYGTPPFDERRGSLHADFGRLIEPDKPYERLTVFFTGMTSETLQTLQVLSGTNYTQLLWNAANLYNLCWHGAVIVNDSPIALDRSAVDLDHLTAGVSVLVHPKAADILRALQQEEGIDLSLLAERMVRHFAKLFEISCSGQVIDYVSNDGEHSQLEFL